MKLTETLLLVMLVLWLGVAAALTYFKLVPELATVAAIGGILFFLACLAILRIQRVQESEARYLYSFYYKEGYRHAQKSTIQYLHTVQQEFPKGLPKESSDAAYVIIEGIIDGVTHHHSNSLEKVENSHEQVS
ncbi:MAG: hypothetical protein V3T31_06650 [candidate division Zixibacteria bacterium]